MNTPKTLLFKGSPASPLITWNNFFTKGEIYSTTIEGDDYYIVYCDLEVAKKVPKILFEDITVVEKEDISLTEKDLWLAAICVAISVGTLGVGLAYKVNWQYIGIPILCFLLIRLINNKALK